MSLHSQITTHSASIGQRNAYLQNHKPTLIHNVKSQYSIYHKINSNSFNVSNGRQSDFSLQMSLVDFFTSNKANAPNISIEALKNELLNIIKGKHVGSLTPEELENFYDIVKNKYLN